VGKKNLSGRSKNRAASQQGMSWEVRVTTAQTMLSTTRVAVPQGWRVGCVDQRGNDTFH